MNLRFEARQLLDKGCKDFWKSEAHIKKCVDRSPHIQSRLFPSIFVRQKKMEIDRNWRKMGESCQFFYLSKLKFLQLERRQMCLVRQFLRIGTVGKRKPSHFSLRIPDRVQIPAFADPNIRRVWARGRLDEKVQPIHRSPTRGGSRYPARHGNRGLSRATSGNCSGGHNRWSEIQVIRSRKLCRFFIKLFTAVVSDYLGKF